jgi:hypothetical protein
MSVLPIDRHPVILAEIHPALRSFRDEARAFAVRFLAYVCGLASLAAILADLLVGPVGAAIEPKPAAAEPGWTAATRLQPVFTIAKLDFSGVTEPYEALRHPEGGRKDTLRWALGPAGKPTAEVEIYRPGDEIAEFEPADAILARRIGNGAPVQTEAAGLIASKFGPVSLLRLSATESGDTCMGFARSLASPRLQITGWVCQPPSGPAQRVAIACALDQFVLLSAGNDPKLAEWFAAAELKRAGCGTTTGPNANWMTGVRDPALRGSL